MQQGITHGDGRPRGCVVGRGGLVAGAAELGHGGGGLAGLVGAQVGLAQVGEEGVQQRAAGRDALHGVVLQHLRQQVQPLLIQPRYHLSPSTINFRTWEIRERQSRTSRSCAFGLAFHTVA